MVVTKPAWEKRYLLKVFVTDILIILAAVIVAQVSKFGLMHDYPDIPVGRYENFSYSYTLLSIAIIVVWLLSLQFFETRDLKIIGSGPGEYKRVLTATLATFGLLSVFAFLFKSPIGRGYLFNSFAFRLSFSFNFTLGLA